MYMNIEIIENNIATLSSNEVVIHSLQDAVDLLGNANYLGAVSIILKEDNLTPLFFDLKTKIAGDILQKYSNYQMKLAIIGEFGKYNSSSLNSFIIESNRGNSLFFVSNYDTAMAKLNG